MPEEPPALRILQIKCNGCGAPLDLSEEQVGDHLECSECGTRVRWKLYPDLLRLMQQRNTERMMQLRQAEASRRFDPMEYGRQLELERRQREAQRRKEAEDQRTREEQARVEAAPGIVQEPQRDSHPNLRECPDCGQAVSRRARSCPHCGCPLQERLPDELAGVVPKLAKAESKSDPASICAILSVVFGLASFIICGGVLGLAGFVLGIIAVIFSESRKGLAVFGIVLSIIGGALGMLIGSMMVM